MIDHLDRIDNLGFGVMLSWNRYFQITYDDDITFDILTCHYKKIDNISFEDIIEVSCDIFYSWYNKNLEILKKYESSNNSDYLDKLKDSTLGDITEIVYRDLNLDNILD